MKRIIPFCFSIFISLAANAAGISHCNHSDQCELCLAEALALDSLVMSDPVALFDSMPQPSVNYEITNLSFTPKVFSGFQKIQEVPKFSQRPLKYNLEVMTRIEEEEDSSASVPQSILSFEREIEVTENDSVLMDIQEEICDTLPYIRKYKTPEWLRSALRQSLAQENLLYSYMIDNPLAIEYAYWDLPLPPVLLEEDRSFMAFLNKQELPDFNPEDAVLPTFVLKKKYWLHTVNALLQFSQAFVSPNWYQGGNNYLSLLFGFTWNVNLNEVYHPNLLFQSTLFYKLAISSNPTGYLHKYTIAEDNFQYNLNVGLKAIKKWYYSFNLQFKTQLLNNYEQDSYVRTASFLSPGDLNMGLGMTYTHKNKLNTLQYTFTVSPISYNLKTCISDKVNHEAYNIPMNRKTKSEVGSNLDFTMDWKITANISYKTRVFMFTDYHYFLGDWQNTFNFDINKFLSTQLMVHLRYDGSTEITDGWKRFMMREILSFGLSYTFSTKP